MSRPLHSCLEHPQRINGVIQSCGTRNNAMNDSEAILQTTMLIAALTIFVFGGSITALAIKVLVYILQ